MAESNETPRAEHPNPIFERADWQTLNGRWEFGFDPANEGEQRRWWASTPVAGRGPRARRPFDREIVVPFPWESSASGIAEPGYRGVAWYRRRVAVPAEWRERGLEPVLHFGAVDWAARVWVNGRVAAEHEGGYTPFSVNLAAYRNSDAPLEIVVRVRDDCEAATLLGKQTLNWYTPTSGIWQPVWLEGCPADHIAHVDLTPSLANGTITARILLSLGDAGSYTLRISSDDDAFPAQEQTLTREATKAKVRLVDATINVLNPRAWSPEDPHLYPLTVELRGPTGTTDVVRTYTGLRDISTGRWDGREYEYILLNGEPLYLRAALDQAFHPEGIYTYPSDDAIRADLQLAKDHGLNALRCHIKINDPRYYSWADRLGVLIMQDIPNPAIATPAARAAWQQCLRATIERDGNHPSIFSWVLFNETWGLTEHDKPASWRWLAEQVAQTKERDPSRLVEDNSPCNYDHVATDLNTWHFYLSSWEATCRHVQDVVDRTYPGSTYNYVSGLSDVTEAREYVQGTQPLLNSEYAGVSAAMGDRDISQSLKYQTTELRRHDKICGYIYTELTDVEWEHNGLVEYDRSAKEFGYDRFVPGMTTADLLGADVVGLDAPPCQTLPPGASFRAAAFVSHWSRRDLQGSTLHWRIEAVDNLGERYVWRDGQQPLSPRRYAVTDAGEIAAKLPEQPGLVTISLRLVDAHGDTTARNYVNVEVWALPAPRCERVESGWVARVAPGEYVESAWMMPRLLGRGAKLAAGGAGGVVYAFPWPDGLAPTDVRGLRLKLELGTRAASRRASPWSRRQPTDFPQTEPARQQPGDVRLSLNGVAFEACRLADDANDARGILSFNLGDAEDSSHGELVEVEVAGERVGAVAAEAAQSGRFLLQLDVPGNGEPARGLSIYGERAGAYPLDLTLCIDVAAGR